MNKTFCFFFFLPFARSSTKSSPSLLFLFWKFYNSDTGKLLLSTGWRLLDVPQVIHILEKFLHQHYNIPKFVVHDKFPLVKILLIILCSGVLLSSTISSSFTANLEIRELSGNLKNGPFFTEKSEDYQGILIEYQGNHGKLTDSKKNIF